MSAAERRQFRAQWLHTAAQDDLARAKADDQLGLVLL